MKLVDDSNDTLDLLAMLSLTHVPFGQEDQAVAQQQQKLAPTTRHVSTIVPRKSSCRGNLTLRVANGLRKSVHNLVRVGALRNDRRECLASSQNSKMMAATYVASFLKTLI